MQAPLAVPPPRARPLARSTTPLEQTLMSAQAYGKKTLSLETPTHNIKPKAHPIFSKDRHGKDHNIEGELKQIKKSMVCLPVLRLNRIWCAHTHIPKNVCVHVCTCDQITVQMDQNSKLCSSMGCGIIETFVYTFVFLNSPIYTAPLTKSYNQL